MKILFYRDSHYGIGGIEMQLFVLARGLKAKGIDIYFVTNDKNSDFSKRIIEEGYNIFFVKGFILSRIFKISLFVKKNDINLLHASMIKESIILRFVTLFIKVKLNIFRVHIYLSAPTISGIKRMIYSKIDFISSSLVSYYLPISTHVHKELVKNNIEERKVVLLRDGVAVKQTIENVKESNCWSIVMLSNIIRGKGFEVLLKAVDIFRREGNEDFCINIVGAISDVTYYNEILEEAKRKDVLRFLKFHGFQSYVYSYIKVADVVVLPSDSEGTPNSLLEAMSLKKVVIASNVGAIPEMIMDKQEGFLHPKGDYFKLAQLLSYVHSLEKKELQEIGNRAYSKWLKHYSVEQYVNGYLQLIQF